MDEISVGGDNIDDEEGPIIVVSFFVFFFFAMIKYKINAPIRQSSTAMPTTLPTMIRNE